MQNSLKTVFDNYFQGEQDFNEFLARDFLPNVSEFFIDGRLVYTASDNLKEYHSFIKSSICKNFLFCDSAVYSYRSDKTTVDAVRKHAGSRHFYQTDIQEFFPSIDAKLIKSALLRSINTMPFKDLGLYADRITELVTVREKLPPGFSTSPAISNAVLYEFDNLFLQYCGERGVQYSRYSDDIIISGKDNDILVAATKTLRIFFIDLYGKQFSFNPAKTKFTHIGRKIKLLGLNILPNGSVVIDNVLRKKIETLLYSYSTDPVKFLSITNKNLTTSKETLAGYLNFASGVDETYVEKLKRKYGSATVEGFLGKKPDAI